MQNKKLEWQRVLIFFVLSYLIAYIPEIAFGWKLGEFQNWSSNPKILLPFLFVTYSPALAVVITRLITKEGWKDSYLHFHFKGNEKYYILATFLLLIDGFYSGIVSNLMMGKSAFEGSSLLSIMGVILFTTAYSVPASFINFGEELGWRGYFYPKLEKLIGDKATIIIGGIIWGLWHAPLTVKGHNFGTDYPCFPYLGLLFMSLFCIGSGTFLMWLTKKTNSIYPASIAHAVNNNVVGVLSATIAPTEQENPIPMVQSSIMALVFQVIICIIFGILIIKMNKNQKNPAT